LFLNIRDRHARGMTGSRRRPKKTGGTPASWRSIMRVADVMTGRVVTVPPTMTAWDARERMRLGRTHHLVVVDGNRLVGVVSAQDLGGRRSDPPDGTVGDRMTRPVVTVPPSATTRRAANLMRGQTIGSLVVMERGRVVGILTVSDLLELLGRGADRSVERGKRWTLKHRVAHKKRASPTGVW
jgi:CBS domain-containing protein